MRKLVTVSGVVGLVIALTVPLNADVKSRQKTLVKFEGMLGKVAGMFGGKAAKEGVINTVVVVGDRQMTTTDQTAELIDLAAEKVYRIDLRNKSYKVQTFAEIRQEWEKAQAEMQKERPAAEQAQPGSEYEIDVDVKETGQSRTIAGYPCRQVVTTLTIRQKGKRIEDGGMVMTADSWLGPEIPALREQAEFQQRYLQKVFGTDAVTTAKDLAQAMAMYPQLKSGMERMRKEAGKLTGTPVLVTTTMEGVSSPEQAKAEQERGGAGIGGIAGGIGGMLGRRKKAEEAPAGGAPKTPGRSAIMTTTTELLGVETTVAAQEVEIPAGFKQK